ncbi:transposase [Streptomyces sp. NPDC004267]|uniref:transposase n=1 Tax=Streptomyces sp. NPDC004267 TaxID=3364694 RepID=UPI0036988419
MAYALGLVELACAACRTGCGWRDVPKRYGAWSAVYSRFNTRVRVGCTPEALSGAGSAGSDHAVPTGLLQRRLALGAQCLFAWRRYTRRIATCVFRSLPQVHVGTSRRSRAWDGAC